METLWIKEEEIEKAAELLKKGEVVSFPTETVYGLGADASNDEAVNKIYEAKGRPNDNPLIIHLHDKSQVSLFTDSVPEKAEQLMDAFWPGPLTIILNHTTNRASKKVTAGLSSIGLRIPSHPHALKLLKATNLPLAAPSANTSGKPSPTSAEHVWHDLNGKIAGVVDGGDTGVGLESTVIDLTNDGQPIILRPGGVPQEAIENIIGAVESSSLEMDRNHIIERPKAPGMKYRHYSPDKPVIIAHDNWAELVSKLLKKEEKIGILASDSILDLYSNQVESIFSLGAEDDVHTASQLLYKGLRYFDDSDVTVILVQSFEKKGLGVAYMNRLEKAAGK